MSEFEKEGIYDIKRLCKALKISRSEYYYHKNHRTNVYKEDNRSLDVDILRIYNESKKRYGSPKIQKILENEGRHVSVKRVGKRMKFLKIKSCIVKKYRPGSSSKKVDNEGKKNLLNQEFQADELRTKMVSDITYIYVKNYDVAFNKLIYIYEQFRQDNYTFFPDVECEEDLIDILSSQILRRYAIPEYLEGYIDWDSFVKDYVADNNGIFAQYGYFAIGEADF